MNFLKSIKAQETKLNLTYLTMFIIAILITVFFYISFTSGLKNAFGGG